MNLRQDVFDSVETDERPLNSCASSPVHSPCSEDVGGNSTDQILSGSSRNSNNSDNDPSRPIKRDTYLNNVIEIHNTGDVSLVLAS